MKVKCVECGKPTKLYDFAEHQHCDECVEKNVQAWLDYFEKKYCAQPN